MKASDITQLIREGEGESLEFKSSARGTAETACAFANTFGGTILVGLDDEGVVVGVTKKDEERVSTALKALSPPPGMSIGTVTLDRKRILVIRVDRMDSLVSLGTLAYVRVGRGNRPLSVNELVQRSVQLGLIQFDAQPSTAGPELLEEGYLEKYLRDREKQRGVKVKGSLAENARRLKILVKDGRSRRMSFGGLLCFSKSPQDYLPGSALRVIRLDAEGRTESAKEFDGPLWQVADRAVSALVKGFATYDVRAGAGRKKVLEYPEWAVREAVVNAVAHRNYALDSDIRIFVYPDRLMIRSPGAFPRGVTPEQPEHMPVNPLICQYLYDMGYIERYGFGITRILEVVKGHPFCDVAFDLSPLKTDVTFRKTTGRGLDDIDQKLLSVLDEGPASSTTLGEAVGLSRPAIVSRLKKLQGIGFVTRNGSGPRTLYSRT